MRRPSWWRCSNARGVPVEFHLYERGIHGMALADHSTASREDLLNDEAATWARLCANWLALDDKGELSHC